ncbi:MAG: tetratricopeptide repeat protein, partial [Bacteroidales bacterium]|nr:tetratricopeptide repeat protein [Bacteroidales bacterium]
MRITIRFFISFIYLFFFHNLYCQLDKTDEIKKNAELNFKRNDFEQALLNYEDLLMLYPQDPEYHYRKGLCLFEMNAINRYNEAALSLEYAAAKGDENKAWYYLGKVQLHQQKYDEAIKAFTRFKTIGKRKDTKRLQVDADINLAKSKYQNGTTNQNEVTETTEVKVIEQPDNNLALKVIPASNSNSENDVILKYAMQMQFAADTLTRCAKEKRAYAKSIKNEEEKKNLGREITQLEKEAAKKQKTADSCFSILSNSSEFQVL